MFANGKGGVTVDYKKSLEYYLKSSDQGNAKSQNDIGKLLHRSGARLP